MKAIKESHYSDLDKSILQDELNAFKEAIAKFDKQRPFYTYAICKPNGIPFYIGKGKGIRAWHHLKNFINGKLSQRYMEEEFSMLEEPPIIFILESNLTEQRALDLEEQYISEYGRKIENGILCNIMPHGKGNVNTHVLCSVAGKMGGKITKRNKSGIFSDDYDRSAETKRRWVEGVISKQNFDGYRHCSVAGKKTKDSCKGIFDPNYNRSAQNKKRWDSYSEEDRDKKKEFLNQMSRSTSKIPTWTNGEINVKSLTWPGPDWLLGQVREGKVVVYNKFDGNPASTYYVVGGDQNLV